MCLFLTETAFGATKTWDAGGIGNDWNTPANWNLNLLPSSGDDLVFPTGVAPTRKSMNNSGAFNLLKLTFQDSGYTITGNSITLGSGGIAVAGNATVSLPITMGATQTFSVSTGLLQLTQPITMGALDLTFAGPGNTTIGANISGAAGALITFNGGGRQEILPGATLSPVSGGSLSSSTGNVLIVNGAWTGGLLTAEFSSVVGGTGSISSLTIRGATIAPGNSGVGRLIVTGTLTANTLSNKVALELGAATTAGSTYDQLRCQGAVNLSNFPTLELTAVAGFAPTVGQVFTLLDKTSAGAISGFFGQGQGAVVTVNGASLQLSYTGGDGNDLIATVIDDGINASPVNSIPGTQTTNEDTAKIFSTANGNAISVSDSDADTNSVQVTLNSGNGAATLSGVTGLTFDSGDGTADVAMTFRGTLTNVNNALNGLSFLPNPNFVGSASLGIVTNDQGNTGSGAALTDTDTVAITVTAVNDAPVNTLPTAQTTAEDTNLVLSTANGNAVSIIDADAGANLVRVTLTASNGLFSLGTVAGLAFSVGDGTSDGTATFTGTITNINAALNGLTFAPTANFNGSGSVAMVTNDQNNTGSGGAQSDLDTLAFTITPVNDAPAVTVTATNQAATEDTPKTLQGNFITISDGDIGSGSIEVTLTCTNGTATLNGTSGLTYTIGDGTDDVQMVFTGTIPDINSRLTLLTFTPPSNFNGVAQLQITANDQGSTGAGGPLSDTKQITFNFAAVNDAPVNVLPGAQTIAEDTALTFTGATAITTSDVDVAPNSLLVTLTGANGTVTLSGTAGLSFTGGDGSNDPTMTFAGTQAAIQTALEGMSFAPNANFNGSASLQITTSDQGSTGSGGAKQDNDTLAITVTSVPDMRTWVGSGNLAWSTTNNWNPVGAPEPGDSLIFPPTDNTSSDNNLTGGAAYGSITVTGGGYGITGNSFSCGSLSFVGTSASTALSAGLALNANLTITANGAAPVVFTSIDLNQNVVELFTQTATDSIDIAGVIFDAGSVRKTGPGLLILSTSAQSFATYAGSTTVEAGTLRVSGTATLGDAAAGTTVLAGALLELQPSFSSTTAESLSLAGTLATGAQAVTLSGPVSLTGTPIIQAGAGGLSFTGALTGSGQVQATGAVSLGATGTMAVAQWVIDGGSLAIDGNASATPLLVSGGTLKGNGSGGPLTVSADGGLIAPGASIGSLALAGMDLTGGSVTLQIEMDATANDSITVTGAVNLGSTSISLITSGPVDVGRVLLVIANDGNDPVLGLVNGASEGSTVSLAFLPFRISYVGGDGNDVSLTRLNPTVTGVTREWDGGGLNNLWSTPANWVGDVAPVQGDSLRFPTAAPQTSNTNDLPADFSVDRLEIQRNGLVITGNRLRLLGDVEETGAFPSSGASVNLPLLLTRATTFRAAATELNNLIVFNGEIDTAGFDLTLQDVTDTPGTQGIFINGRISGTGKVITTGSVNVSALSNSSQAWTGGTDVMSGILSADGFGAVRAPLRIGGGTQDARCSLNGSLPALEDGADITFLANGRLDLSMSINTGNLIFSGGIGLSSGNGFGLQDRIFVRGDIRFLAAGGSHVLATTFTPAGDHRVEVAAGLDQLMTANLVTSIGARMVKTGPGKLRLQAQSGSAATIEAREGVLSFAQDFQFCPVFLNGGVLTSETDVTRIKTLTAEANGGVIQLGNPLNPPGVRTSALATETITLNSATTFRVGVETRPPFGLAQTAADKLSVAGNVILNNAALDLQLLSGFEAYAGQTLTLIENNTAAPISGTFAGVPEGQLMTIGRVTFRCSYLGGDGNDFTVTVGLLPTNVTRVWDGGGTSNNWTEPQNWVGDIAPIPGDSIEIPGTSPRPNGFVNFPEGTTFHSLRLNGTGLDLSGNEISLTGGIDLSSTSGGFNFLPRVRIVATPTIQSTGPANFTVSVTLFESQLHLNVAPGVAEFFNQANGITLRNTKPALVIKTGAGRAFVEQAATGVPGLDCRIDAGTLQLRQLAGDVQIGGAGQPAKALVFGPSSSGATIINGTVTAGPQGTLETRDAGLLQLFRLVLDGGTVAHSAFSGTPSSELAVRESITTLGGASYVIPSRVIFEHPSGGPVTVAVAAGGSLSLTGALASNFANSFLEKTGAGDLILSSTTASESPLLRMDITGGRALVNGSLGSLRCNLTGGTLGGSGRVAGIETPVSGTVTPGQSPGLLRADYLVWNSDTTVRMELGGTTAGGTYDQIETDSLQIELGSASLAITSFGGFLPSTGESFVLLRQMFAGSVAEGTFNGLNQSDSFNAIGRRFRISYTGGDGNDVVITCLGYDPTDSDNDELPDAWEQEFFGDLAEIGTDDSDGDGKTNHDEFVAGTSPVDAGSVIVVRLISHSTGASVIGLKPVLPGRTYVLERSTTLATGSFSAVTGATFVDVSGERRFTDPSPPTGSAFYRISIQQVP